MGTCDKDAGSHLGVGQLAGRYFIFNSCLQNKKMSPQIRATRFSGIKTL